MKLNKFGLLAFGVLFLYLGIHDLLVGETNSFGAGNMSSIAITFASHPIQFILSITFQIIVGGIFVIKGLSKKAK